jgi:hypothetical protein
MTFKASLHVLAAISPEFCHASPSMKRAQGMPGAQAAPAALCAKDGSTQA